MSPSPLLALEHDQEWIEQRPLPLEPYRIGKVVCSDSERLAQYPDLISALEEHEWQASYIHPKFIQGTTSPLRSLSNTFLNAGDLVTASIVAALTFPSPTLKRISAVVQRDLAAIQLGPNTEFTQKIVNQIKNNSEFLTHLQKLSKERTVTVCDPFGGGGILCFVLAEFLEDVLGENFVIYLLDLHDTGYLETQPLIKTLGKKKYQKLKKHIIFTQTDGIEMSKISNETFDLIVSTLALHEHSTHKLVKFFNNARNKLTKGGQVIIADTTREPVILKRAEKRLPILSKVGMSFVTLKHLIRRPTDLTFLHLGRSAVSESKWLVESGISSYRSGLLKEELSEVIINGGFSKDRINVFYDYSPPVGGVVITCSK